MLAWEWWGDQVPYKHAWERQRARRERVQAGQDEGVLALLEHTPVVTFGRRDAPGNPSDDTLRALGLDVHHTERGGLATWHGPGQLVGYLICDLRVQRLKVRQVIYAMEQGVIDWLQGCGLDTRRRCDAPGVWVGGDKICAVGLNIQRQVTMHGFALNLQVSKQAFAPIVPCGLQDAGVTSLDRLVECAPTPHQAADGVAAAVLSAMQRRANP